jgi:SAM-dependent methyltransferase
MTRYDRTGRTYSHTRRGDPRIAAAISHALAGAASIANVGAGTGSYEPARTIVAIEPSQVMIRQRPAAAAPAVQAAAEALPLRTNAVAAVLAVLTVHHWADLAAGVAEMQRVASRRVIVLTWDHDVIRDFWLLRDYVPAAADTDARLAVPMDDLVSLLGPDRVAITPIPVPHDCADGFGGAYWRRPQAYLDDTVRQGMSLFAMTPADHVAEGLTRLRGDLASGHWRRRYAELLRRPELDLGYRLITADVR